MDDEKILGDVDFTDFEEHFKVVERASMKKASAVTPDSPALSVKSNGSADQEVTESILDAKRVQNVAIARKKVTAHVELLKYQISQ